GRDHVRLQLNSSRKFLTGGLNPNRIIRLRSNGGSTPVENFSTCVKIFQPLLKIFDPSRAESPLSGAGSGLRPAVVLNVV
ncbi:hypothetical protein TorRG33x02_230810, partial [Trema orientale]